MAESDAAPPFCWCPIDGGTGHFWHATTCPTEPDPQPD